MDFLQSFQQAPEWKPRAQAFDKHKVTAASILDHATRVQAFRLAPQGREKALGTMSGISYFAQGPEQSPAFATKLSAIILDPKTYPFPGQSTKSCYLDPGVDFRVWRDKQFVDVVLCFECNQLVVLENDPKVPKTTTGGWLTGRSYVAGDFDAARPALVALAKQALPEDKTIQAL